MVDSPTPSSRDTEKMTTGISELLDALIQMVREECEADEEGADGLTLGTWEIEVATARQAIEAHFSALSLENQRLRDSQLTERERIHVLLRIEAAHRISPECDYCPAILKKLRSLSSPETPEK